MFGIFVMVAVRNLLSFRLLSKNVKIKIYKTISLPVLDGCENWSLVLREQHRLMVLRRIFGLKRGEMTGGWRKLHKRRSIICNLHKKLL
jgi:hypothetical protein